MAAAASESENIAGERRTPRRNPNPNPNPNISGERRTPRRKPDYAGEWTPDPSSNDEGDSGENPLMRAGKMSLREEIRVCLTPPNRLTLTLTRILTRTLTLTLTSFV